jgi:hypothetical protein
MKPPAARAPIQTSARNVPALLDVLKMRSSFLELRFADRILKILRASRFARFKFYGCRHLRFVGRGFSRDITAA